MMDSAAKFTRRKHYIKYGLYITSVILYRKETESYINCLCDVEGITEFSVFVERMSKIMPGWKIVNFM